jgi:hypothetical protein
LKTNDTIAEAAAPLARTPLAMSFRPVSALLLLIVAAVVALSAAPASAVPAVSCGKVKVHQKKYAVRAHVLSCKKARRWSVDVLLRHPAPAGYECRRFDPKITRVRFVCENPKTRSRSDGPQSFSAST